jgi:CubicO group peptidase (beta-lactamase class C family)
LRLWALQAFFVVDMDIAPARMNRGLEWLFAVALLVAMSAAAFGQKAGEFEAELEKIRARHQLPALAALAMIGGEVRANGAVGLRRLGGTEAVTRNDKWHIGSCTKSMTATLAAMLVERGQLRWDTRVGEVFPELRESMEPTWVPVTLEMLLSHRSGAPGEAPENLWRNARAQVGSPMEQRMSFVNGLLLRRPESPPGTRYIYSNQGYAIAGAMLERVTRKPWEELMRRELFGSCNLTSSGFGAPAAPGRVDQPWGHAGAEMMPVEPGPQADNPPAIGPAGTVHATLTDFARYAALHAVGDRMGTLFLKRDGFRKLHTAPDDQDYALGWIVAPRPWAGGDALTHNGSNTMFFFVVWIAPAKDAVFVAAANCAGAGAEKATDEAVSLLIGKLLR